MFGLEGSSERRRAGGVSHRPSRSLAEAACTFHVICPQRAKPQRLLGGWDGEDSRKVRGKILRRCVGGGGWWWRCSADRRGRLHHRERRRREQGASWREAPASEQQKQRAWKERGLTTVKSDEVSTAGSTGAEAHCRQAPVPASRIGASTTQLGAAGCAHQAVRLLPTPNTKRAEL